MSETPFETALTQFFNYLKFEKKVSVHTVTSYTNDLIQFKDYLITDFEMDDPVIVSHQMIRSWMVTMMDSGLSARSVNRKIACLQSFYKYLIKMGIVKNNPLQKIQRPKQSKKLPVFVDEQHMNRMMDQEFKINENDFSTVRDQVMLLLLYHCGIRRSELIGLKTSDVDFVKGQIKVLGKRNKERIIPILKELQEAIKHYMELKSQSEFNNAELLCSDKGKKLHPNVVYNKVKHFLSIYTTLQKRSPHVLRHTFATHMLNHGADLNAIKELLGHANLAATQIYTQNSFERLKELHHLAHPRSEN